MSRDSQSDAPPTPLTLRRHYDVVILGAGMAGLTLARQLLLETDKSILILDRRSQLPSAAQKVGESTVQLAGYYLSKVLELEEHLLTEHWMKYNLRFHWPTQGHRNTGIEDYSQTFIRKFSNIASYQVDRNRLEAELLRLNRADDRFTLISPTRKLDVVLTEGAVEPHRVRFAVGRGSGGRLRSVTADWVVDCSGRRRFLARKLGLTRDLDLPHGASFLWVEGLLNLETLTDQSTSQARLHRSRRQLGHLPTWLATNHFVGQGFWLWLIPLRGGTSIGLTYDQAEISHHEVSSAEKLVGWICKKFPLFARDLPQRKIRHYGAFLNFSYDCARTLSADRWAMSGEAGRFSDPLYSPGSDLIALHNTLIIDAITTRDPGELKGKVKGYENLLRALFEAYLPSFTTSYNALGDPETFVLKYTWELTIYFAFYVFPFINDLFTQRRFTLAFLNRFSQLGPLNHNMQALLSDFYNWKKAAGRLGTEEPLFVDFLDIGPLGKAEKTFYQVGLDVDQAKKVLNQQLANLQELSRYLVAYICAAVVGNAGLLTNAAFVESLDPAKFKFDPREIRHRWRQCVSRQAPYAWSFDPWTLEMFRHKSPFTVPAPQPSLAAEGGP